MLAHQLSRADGLNGLTQPHLVSNDALSGTVGKTDALFLIRIKAGVEQRIKLAVHAAFGKELFAPAPFTLLQDEVERISIPAECVIQLHGLTEEIGNRVDGFGAHHAFGREIGYGQLAECLGIVAPDAQTHFPFTPVGKINGSVRGQLPVNPPVMGGNPQLHGFHVLART